MESQLLISESESSLKQRKEIFLKSILGKNAKSMNKYI